MKRGLLTFTLLLSLAQATRASDFAISPNASNCNLQSPPSGSGDVQGDEPEFDLKVFPRYRDFSLKYTGCQTSWFKRDDGWHRFSVAYFERGKPATFIIPAVVAEQATDMVCRYRGKKLVADDAHECPSSTDVILLSMPSGCIERIRSGDKPEAGECPDE